MQLLLFVVFYTSTLFLADVALAADPTPVAANILGIADYSQTLPFVDLVKQSRRFGSPGKPWDGDVGVDSNGWPTADFGVILADAQVSMESKYLIRGVFAQQPTISPVVCSFTLQDVVWSPTTKVLTATLVQNNQTQIMVAFRETGGGTKSLSVRAASYDDKALFTRQFLALVEKFSLLRFMDWAGTNGNPAVDWSDRNTLEFPSFAWNPRKGGGAPWEIMFDLGNTVNRDIWINIPHMATDDYVQNLAQLTLQKLSPNLNVYLEYSNEVWNWQFSQATWNLDAAKAEVANGDPFKLNYDKDGNQWYWGYRRVALRLKQIVDIFAKVWGQSAINNRVRAVLAGQVVQPLIAELGLVYIETIYGNPKNYFHAVAGAPYFNLGSLNEKPQMTKEQVLDAMQASVDSMSLDLGIGSHNWLAGNAQLSGWYGLEFRGYEGGPDTFGPNGIEAKGQASLDPRMETICIDYLNNWVEYGFEALNWFSAGAQSYDTQYGTWGITTNMNDLTQPKVLAVDYVRSHPPVPTRLGVPLPGTVNATIYVGHPEPITSYYLYNPAANSTYFYFVQAPRAMQAKLTAWTNGDAEGKLAIGVNNQGDQVVSTPVTKNFAPTASVNFQLRQGVNVVRLMPITNRVFSISEVQVQI